MEILKESSNSTQYALTWRRYGQIYFKVTSITRVNSIQFQTEFLKVPTRLKKKIKKPNFAIFLSLTVFLKRDTINI
jgi:hypothetical protein